MILPFDFLITLWFFFNVFKIMSGVRPVAALISSSDAAPNTSMRSTMALKIGVSAVVETFISESLAAVLDTVLGLMVGPLCIEGQLLVDDGEEVDLSRFRNTDRGRQCGC